MHDRNMSLAAKGKAKENVHWQLGWWDLSHALEGTRRPSQWSKSSIIYTAHEYEARVVGRHFPSSRQFLLPSPPFPYAMESYEPPTVLSICPTDDLLFAYFPGKGQDGFGCVWHKEAQVDSWSVKDTWTYAVGGGVVTAAWSCPHREWTVSEAGSSTRLPAIGPLAPPGNPLLILVTASHMLHVFAIHPQGKAQQHSRVSLLQSDSYNLQSPVEPDSVGKIGGDKICMKAAIGLSYQESTILVATRSQILPSQNTAQAYQNPMDLGLSMDLSQSQAQESPFGAEWELWGEEQIISLCEVRIEWRNPPAISRPLPPIYCPGSLVDLTFYIPLPNNSTGPPTPNRAGKPDSKGQGSTGYTRYLAATVFDTDDYTSLPKSEIVSYSLVTHPSGSLINRSETRRPCPNKLPCFLLPSTSRGGLLVGFLDAGGILPRRKSKSKETSTGTIEVLQVTDLTTHEDWESVPIRSYIQGGTVDVPVSVALSPNDTLICCISSPLLGSRQSLQALPRRVSGDSSSVLTKNLHGDLSRHLITAILARNSPSDVIHALAMPSLPLEVAVNTLQHTYTGMEAHSFGLMEMWTAELVGVATEVYSARTKRLERGPEQDICNSRWQTAHEISSLAACCGAFDTCREGDSYDLDAVWQLLGMTGWVIELVEKLFKECIFVGERPDTGSGPPRDPFGEKVGTTFESSVFLHLVHPFALSRLQTAVEHVKRFHDQVAKLTARGENSHIAKDYLLDITEGSGFDLQLVGPFFSEILQESKSLNAQDLRRSLAACSPVPAFKPHIRKIIDKVLVLKAIDRARLFIKPSDLADGIARLTLSEYWPPAGGTREKNTDVVKKSALWRNTSASVCMRCNGRSDVALDKKGPADAPLSRWQTWERTWQTRCVCGGLWSSSM